VQFLTTAYDGQDAEAMNRRLAVRQSHLELTERLQLQRIHLFGAAILDETGKMIGSILVSESKDRAALEEWLKIEPYVTGGVWEKIEIQPCRVAPSFS
jgi:uncharacterized protein YciI